VTEFFLIDNSFDDIIFILWSLLSPLSWYNGFRRSHHH